MTNAHKTLVFGVAGLALTYWLSRRQSAAPRATAAASRLERDTLGQYTGDPNPHFFSLPAIISPLLTVQPQTQTMSAPQTQSTTTTTSAPASSSTSRFPIDFPAPPGGWQISDPPVGVVTIPIDFPPPPGGWVMEPGPAPPPDVYNPDAPYIPPPPPDAPPAAAPPADTSDTSPSVPVEQIHQDYQDFTP
jgi:hypothetical protein